MSDLSSRRTALAKHRRTKGSEKPGVQKAAVGMDQGRVRRPGCGRRRRGRPGRRSRTGAGAARQLVLRLPHRGGPKRSNLLVHWHITFFLCWVFSQNGRLYFVANVLVFLVRKSTRAAAGSHLRLFVQPRGAGIHTG